MHSMEEIYQQHAQTVFKYLMTLTHDVYIAEELTQETFYQAIKSIGRFNQSCKITTWLCAIAKNQFFTYQRKHQDMENLDALEQIDSSVPSAEQYVFESVNRIEVMKKLHDWLNPGETVIVVIGGN
jgi:RNA polymerase sigma factor (sigma-70 family)